MLRSTRLECPFPPCRLRRRRTGIVTSLHDRLGRLVEIRCDLVGGRGCPLFSALAGPDAVPGPELSAVLRLLDLFGED